MTEPELSLDTESRHSSPVRPRRQPGRAAAAVEQRIAALERELAQMRGREAGWREERRRLMAALEAAEREVADLPALRHEAQVTRDTAYWLAVVQGSWSWRVTRPLRAAGRLGGRLRGRRQRS